MTKQKDLKLWVLSKTKSLTDKLAHSRNNSIDVDTSPTSASSKAKTMDIDNDSSTQRAPKHTFIVKYNPFNIETRYSYVKTLGLGAYGIVCSATDSKTGKQVAVKKVTSVFDDLTDAKRIIREIRLLRCMKHDNILKVLDMDEPEDYTTFNDVYIVTELMDTDLGKLLRSSAKLLDSQRVFFTYHMLRALKYIHSANIIHRDLKPANILVSETCDIKICDFGLARYVQPGDQPGQYMTEYVVTRWYRAPELLLAYDEYNSAIDMWSVGCIIAELYLRRPIFPGTDVKNQLTLICDVLGKPTAKEVASIPNPKARSFVKNLPENSMSDLPRFMRGAGEDALDLTTKLLQFDSAKRLTAAQALEHPYVAQYRDPRTETLADVIDSEKLEPPSEKKLGKAGVRQLMWNEILEFHPSAKGREPQAAKDAQRKVDDLMSGLGQS